MCARFTPAPIPAQVKDIRLLRYRHGAYAYLSRLRSFKVLVASPPALRIFSAAAWLNL